MKEGVAVTEVYFIRHAESDQSVHDDRVRPLTKKGLADRRLVTEFLSGKDINVVISSPYKRAFDTVSDFAEQNGLETEILEDFRERKIGDAWIGADDFSALAKRQWADFQYKLPGGECLSEVQNRNIDALNEVLARYEGKNIVIGTHGTALSAIINYFDKTYGFKDFAAMVKITPWVVKMSFNGGDCMGMKKINLFLPEQIPDYEQCRVYTAKTGQLKAYRFVVIFARYKNKWLYCRAKGRSVFETAGGRTEKGETPIEAARRELYEETGAIKFDIKPVFDYSVHLPTEYSNGQVFLADIQEVGDMPDFETEEIALFDTYPEKMRFPRILPVLYERIRREI